jgi:excisionase family DNA binding protein
MGEKKQEIIARLKRVEAKLDGIISQLDSKQEAIDKMPNHGMDLAVEVTGLSRSTIYNLICARKMPHYKKGKRLYFKRKELEEWIDKGKRKTVDDV